MIIINKPKDENEYEEKKYEPTPNSLFELLNKIVPNDKLNTYNEGHKLHLSDK